MRFAFVGVENCFLPYAARIQDEGHEVLAWSADKDAKFVGAGLIPKTDSFERLVAWAQASPSVVIFDGNGMGQKADMLRRKGLLVVGGGEFCDRLEKDRVFGESIAEYAGIETPKTHTFSNIDATISFMGGQSHDAEFVFKSDKFLESSATHMGSSREELVRYLKWIRERFGSNIKNILQEKVPGAAISTAGWWNGRAFLHPFEGSIEHKKTGNNDLGASAGCAVNLVWFYSQELPRIVEELHWDKIAEMFRKFHAPAGIYDINAIISEADGLPKFLEWTPRFGYDSEPISTLLLGIPLGEFFYRLALGLLADWPIRNINEGVYSVRMGVPPYPWEHTEPEDRKKKSAFGCPLLGPDKVWGEPFTGYGIAAGPNGLYVADPAGLVGLSVAVGSDFSSMAEDALGYIEEDIELPSNTYRTDGGEMIQKDMDAISGLGYEVF